MSKTSCYGRLTRQRTDSDASWRDVVFGDIGAGAGLVADQLRQAIDLCPELRQRVPARSIAPMDAAVRVGQVWHAIQMISTTITIYFQLRHRWVLFEPGVSRVISPLGGT